MNDLKIIRDRISAFSDVKDVKDRILQLQSERETLLESISVIKKEKISHGEIEYLENELKMVESSF